MITDKDICWPQGTKLIPDLEDGEGKERETSKKPRGMLFINTLQVTDRFVLTCEAR